MVETISSWVLVDVEAIWITTQIAKLQIANFFQKMSWSNYDFITFLLPFLLPRSQALSSLPPLVAATKNLIEAGLLITFHTGQTKYIYKHPAY